MRGLAGHARALYLAALLLTFGGLVAALRMPVSLFPHIDYPRVVVAIDAGDRDASQMAAQITRPIEIALRAVPGVTRVRSTTSRGSAEVALDFPWGQDMVAATLATQGALATLLPDLPPGHALRRASVGPDDLSGAGPCPDLAIARSTGSAQPCRAEGAPCVDGGHGRCRRRYPGWRAARVRRECRSRPCAGAGPQPGRHRHRDRQEQRCPGGRPAGGSPPPLPRPRRKPRRDDRRPGRATGQIGAERRSRSRHARSDRDHRPGARTRFHARERQWPRRGPGQYSPDTGRRQCSHCPRCRCPAEGPGPAAQRDGNAVLRPVGAHYRRGECGARCDPARCIARRNRAVRLSTVGPADAGHRADASRRAGRHVPDSVRAGHELQHDDARRHGRRRRAGRRRRGSDARTHHAPVAGRDGERRCRRAEGGARDGDAVAGLDLRNDCRVPAAGVRQRGHRRLLQGAGDDDGRGAWPVAALCALCHSARVGELAAREGRRGGGARRRFHGATGWRL